MPKKLIPLSVPSLKGNELKYVSECIETEWVSTAGGYVNRFEDDIKRFTGAPRAIACVNGTAALHTSLILCGVERGDEVLVPTLTFIAPINAVTYIGANPVFMDCDDFLNIDPRKLSEFIQKECNFDGTHLFNKRTGAKIKAILPVHIFGHPVQIEPIMELAKKYNLHVIEDATESLGSTYREGLLAGKMTGTIGHVGCYSFNGNKIITTGGGGMIVTQNDKMADEARYLTTQAKDDDELFIHHQIGYNYRLTNIQAAIGCAQLESLNNYVEIKRRNFGAYQEMLLGIPGLKLLEEPRYGHSNYWYYTLVVDSKRYGLSNLELRAKLQQAQIDSKPLWTLNHHQKPYKKCQAYKIEKANSYYDRCLNLPCSVNLSVQDISKITGVIRDSYGKA